MRFLLWMYVPCAYHPSTSWWHVQHPVPFSELCRITFSPMCVQAKAELMRDIMHYQVVSETRTLQVPTPFLLIPG